MMLFWFPFLLIIFALPFLVFNPEKRSTEVVSRNKALDILKSRYAKGEIGKEEFEEKRKDLID